VNALVGESSSGRGFRLTPCPLSALDSFLSLGGFGGEGEEFFREGEGSVAALTLSEYPPLPRSRNQGRTVPSFGGGAGVGGDRVIRRMVLRRGRGGSVFWFTLPLQGELP
jgi:hypothetical protein